MSDTGPPDLSVRHPDRRIARTLTALVEAFAAQALVEPVEKMAVKDLVERAGIGRSTFYEHFASVEDLLLWLVDELVGWAKDDAGRIQLDGLLAFVAEMGDVTAAFLEVDSCAARCEAAIADSLTGGDLTARRFASSGVMGSLRLWLGGDLSGDKEEFVARTCALVDAALTSGTTASNEPAS